MPFPPPNPEIFSIDLLFGITLTLRWYGVLAAVGILVGTLLADREIGRRGGRTEVLWDSLLWIVPAGVVGARLWYVLNDILGGNTYFTEDAVRIFQIQQGGLHIYGAILGGLIAAIWYLRRERFDIWLFLDAMAPALLIGQAIGRIANWINQELYGPPTDLSWGVPIEAQHRIAPWNDLSLYPVDTTRFHPTYFYEAIWNVIGAGLLLWLGRRFSDRLKPGVVFAGWLIWAGVGRFVLEWFRPDQPTIPGTAISYSRIVAGLLAVGGIVTILVKYKKISLPFFPAGPDTYQTSTQGDWRSRKRAKRENASS
ncbi:MAG: prolipoprotein diacylglyceryl transferase [Chloroflexi bacterium]|nr:MAG: prolipoprotein diacylglyceryl transferase [Chloroflexota bacterium]MBL1195271.1 prolipoprotein diacylglyceryl transferase [Chloroflexota bacterium]NOH12555.1 prolipoprotein diacylglyceryl transferase [Chloroflexota bacterium]